ncbi:hypothetical protein BC343_14860 [Mucilaginibacter pedocola]|uniref:Uncharacterized protein n=1 Tax=Mucilaginibacter pedocola TaxID=1792845 RepID=A0A1S9P8Y7_9SPHI|nr:hypothetical protein BC343_14860 [Mucilaginibacter pedocola]
MQENQSQALGHNENDKLYATPGNNRHIAFGWPDGRLRSLNYAYLVSSEHIPEEGLIQLEFTTHKITLKGYNLEQLYFQIFDQVSRIILCVDKRYTELDNSKSVVNEIICAAT